MNLLAVNFHYFRESTYKGGIYPTSMATFERQLDGLSRSHRFVSQDDIASWVRGGDVPDGNHCVVTVDDGLREQMAMFDVLNRKGIPAIFYAPTDPIRHHKVLSTHQLHFVRTQLSDSDVYDFLVKHSDIAECRFDEEIIANQYRYDGQLARRVKFYLNFVATEALKQALVQQLFDSLVSDEAVFARDLYMGEQDLRRLAAVGALGSHGSAHLPLATLSPEDAERDVAASVAYLESVGGRPIVSFSYPFGGDAAVSRSLAPILERAGLQFAFTMKRGINHREHLSDALFLRRIDTKDLST